MHLLRHPLLEQHQPRAGLLLITALVIGGVGCFTVPNYTPQQLQRQHEEAGERLRQIEARAAQGDVNAMVIIGAHYMSNLAGDKKDEAKGMAYLERAAATGAGIGLTKLGIELVTGYPRKHTTAERQHGLDLLKQAAIKGCSFSANLNDVVSPHLYLAGQFEDTDPVQAELWRARSIVHCGAFNPYYSSARLKTATREQASTEWAAWTLLAKPATPRATMAKDYPQANLDAAQQRADALRQAVRDSERDFPPPPRSSR